MKLSVVCTLALFPIYVALRYPFFLLPLHMDTGFYVSNHTVCTRRLDYSRGWNARFAGCSKVLPEMFYSVVYLAHGGEAYKWWSRFYYSIYNYVCGVLVGVAVAWLTDGSTLAYCAGLTAYCLLSSEPHYGVYFESGEQFEVLFQVAGFLLILKGLRDVEPWWLALGVGLWMFDGFFVKLSTLVGVVIWMMGLLALFPGGLLALLGVGTLTSAMYGAWILWNGRSVWELARAIVGHERVQGHSVGLREYVTQFAVKTGWLARQVVGTLPLIPACALLGMWTLRDTTVLLLYAGTISVTYAFQAALVWYYAIPGLPLVAALAGSGVVWMASRGVVGWVVIALLVSLWVAWHVTQSYGRLLARGLGSLNGYAWRPHGSGMAERNLALDRAAPELRMLVGRQSVFVFGMWNQAYVLLDASYDTPLVSAARWLDMMAPGWERELNARLVEEPPRFLLDTDRRLDTRALTERLGLEYEPVGCWEGLGLLRFKGRVAVVERDTSCEPFAPKVRKGGAEGVAP